MTTMGDRMKRLMISLYIRLHDDESGASIIEYGFLAMLIAVAALLSIEFLGNATTSNVEAVIPAFEK